LIDCTTAVEHAATVTMQIADAYTVKRKTVLNVLL